MEGRVKRKEKQNFLINNLNAYVHEWNKKNEKRMVIKHFIVMTSERRNSRKIRIPVY